MTSRATCQLAPNSKLTLSNLIPNPNRHRRPLVTLNDTQKGSIKQRFGRKLRVSNKAEAIRPSSGCRKNSPLC